MLRQSGFCCECGVQLAKPRSTYCYRCAGALGVRLRWLRHRLRARAKAQAQSRSSAASMPERGG
jgi:hypothetical protein